MMFKQVFGILLESGSWYTSHGGACLQTCGSELPVQVYNTYEEADDALSKLIKSPFACHADNAKVVCILLGTSLPRLLYDIEINDKQIAARDKEIEHLRNAIKPLLELDTRGKPMAIEAYERGEAIRQFKRIMKGGAI